MPSIMGILRGLWGFASYLYSASHHAIKANGGQRHSFDVLATMSSS